MQSCFPAAARASGKVLVAGGYGVLEQGNCGLTLAVDSCFYCLCTEHEPTKETRIRVRSFQIGQAWQYTTVMGGTEQPGIAEIQGKSNAFVENAVLWALKYFDKFKDAGSINLELVFTRNFISDKDALDDSEFPRYGPNYSKTGLGSSACVVVSIVKCLCLLFTQHQPDAVSVLQRRVNLISQLANLAAQKKIGSNFDISTAVYGSHLYRNVLPYKIDPLIKNYHQQAVKQLEGIDPEVRSIKVQGQLWAYIVDINKGADTRTMVKSFLSQLRKSEAAWQEQFFSTSKHITLSLFDALSQRDLTKCQAINSQHRALQRKYSLITGVPIQPQDLTPLLDTIQQIPEVLYAICPGSGGYDAIFVLAQAQILKPLEESLQGHTVRRIGVEFENGQQIAEKELAKVKAVLGTLTNQ